MSRACLKCTQCTLGRDGNESRVIISKKPFMGFVPVGKEVIGNTLISKMQKISLLQLKANYKASRGCLGKAVP